MKTIKLWDIRFPDRPPARLSVADGLASAMVRAGVAAPVDPAEAGALMAGGALSAADLTEVTLEAGNSRRMVRVALPLSVVMIGAGLGVLAAIGTPVAGTPTPIISFSLPSATVPEGNSGTTAVPNTINVTRNGVTGDLVVNLSTGGTATAGTDYTALPLTVTIPDGQNSVAFNLSVGGDATVEPDENVIIYAQLAAYPSATASKTITIANDDAAAVAPTIVSAPTFTGTAQVGQLLTGQHGAYNNSPTSYANQWQSSADGGISWVDISGATALTYLLTSGESGKVVRLGEVASNATGSAPVNYSAPSAAVAAGGQSIITPANWDFVNYGDSRGENAFPNAVYTSAAGYGANTATTGPTAWLQQESGNRLRPALYPNFGMSATTTTQGAANPRVSVHGDNANVSLARNQTVPSEWWRGVTSRASAANQETNCGPFNKGPEAVATSGAGVMFLLYGTNDQNGDLAGLSRDNVLAILNRAGGSVLKVILNETSKGVRTDGTLNYTMQANLPAYADWLKTLSFDSGSPNARNDVIVVDTFTPTYDAANTRIKQGYLRDGLHFSPWGAREIAKLVHARLTAVYGAAYTGIAPRVILPVSNGASIAADQIGVAHGGFIHTNPLMTQGTGGALQGTNWAVGPATSGIPQGWTASGTGTGAGITIVAERSVDPDGYPQVTLTFSGTLVDSATYTFSLYQTAQQAGQFTINDKLRSFARVIVAAGSQQFQGVKLRSYLFSSTAGLAQQIVDMNNSAGAPADRVGYLINSNGYDAGGYDTIMATQLADVQNPNMQTANGGFGTATAVGNFSQVGVWADMVFSNYTGATQPISAVIKISRMGMTKVSN